MAPSRAKSAAGRGVQGGGVMLWLAGGLAVLMVLSSALPALCLFLPSLLVLFTEQERSRTLTRAVLLFGLAGAWGTLGRLWALGGLGLASWNTVNWVVALDIHRIALAWAAQAGGWLLTEVLAFALAQLSERQIARVQANAGQRKGILQAEWHRHEPLR